ncbi:hypothetical protein CJ186_03215 [Actinomyces graevenitzii]|uniref:hypothetical protein n=1 Tax=Actinomyces graevenitzii TaxID=55565 RepID=UPI000C800E60|nr:hypothetical protein [Actinomyces graevenitzii]PMC92504.1 hypothetical protein CJ186_03215 [Actinomyces graevenitzii]
MCESQSEKAFNEKLIRSRWVSGQVPQVSLQPMPFVPPPKKVLSAKGKRKRLIFIMLALCFGIPAVSLILSPFIVSGIIDGVPGDHSFNGDGWGWRALLAIVYITPIGSVVFAISAAMIGLAARVKE